MFEYMQSLRGIRKKRMKLCGTEVLKKLGENKISRKDSVVSPEYRKVISSSKKKENR